MIGDVSWSYIVFLERYLCIKICVNKLFHLFFQWNVSNIRYFIISFHKLFGSTFLSSFYTDNFENKFWRWRMGLDLRLFSWKVICVSKFALINSFIYSSTRLFPIYVLSFHNVFSSTSLLSVYADDFENKLCRWEMVFDFPLLPGTSFVYQNLL